ncbi:hypothetical protein [Neorhizobium galegae]|uniref:hypothetical protein n=1 Tax=Neorhizobium galegae TaxID=399 RepID=UPI0012D4DF26|nr:hypothetical protein [Neorhizobium galegae]KAB1123224.1 hypothetical protein F4V90_16610 [Neorhizobium galegae]MCQ1569200.1 hypothetical protein [Neorhizobium galegae]MCQ1807229.1 hypothetical protein [Neorhizobium galegae]
MSVPLSVASRRHFSKRHFKHKIIGKNVNGFLCRRPTVAALVIAAHHALNLQAGKTRRFRPSTRRSRWDSQFLAIGNFRLEVIYTSFYDPSIVKGTTAKSGIENQEKPLAGLQACVSPTAAGPSVAIDGQNQRDRHDF